MLALAHQVLRALAVDSGYTETSLSEYLFPYELAFALHPNGRSQFSIGALRTVLEQNLDAVVNRAVDNDTCLYDPNCTKLIVVPITDAYSYPRPPANAGTATFPATTSTAHQTEA